MMMVSKNHRVHEPQHSDVDIGASNATKSHKLYQLDWRESEVKHEVCVLRLSESEEINS